MKNIKRKNVDFILFAINQAKAAEHFGFKRNICCRNLKTALLHYWQHKNLGLSSTSRKDKISRSIAAQKSQKNECVVEHVVPMMVIVNLLMEMKPLTKRAVIQLLERLYHVRLVTHDEHNRLTKLKLRSEMPANWDGSNIFARYAAAKINVKSTI
jgi:hypothetical protein